MASEYRKITKKWLINNKNDDTIWQDAIQDEMKEIIKESDDEAVSKLIGHEERAKVLELLEDIEEAKQHTLYKHQQIHIKISFQIILCKRFLTEYLL